MKKTFSLTHHKIKTPRLVDAIRHEVKQYIKRERKKELPDNVDFWDFDCRFGTNEANSDEIHLAEISDCISKAEATQMESFYLEIIAKPRQRSAKPEKPTSPYDGAYLDS